MINTQGVSTTNPIEINVSRQFLAWLFEQKLSITFTTYQGGKLFFIGLTPTGELSIYQRNFPRCMGLYLEENSLWMSSLYQLWRIENILQPGEFYDNYDCLYLPQMSYITGDLDIHDLAVDPGGKVIFVNTLFSCLATISPTHSFLPLWQPPFISRLAAEDRCHLNGLAMVDRTPKYVTSVSQSDVADGWREKRNSGGCVIDVESNQIIAESLSMPHSPRYHQGTLWLLNSGLGEFGYIDLKTGQFEAIAFCPGYLRGLATFGNYAIVGLSKPRDNQTFSGLDLDRKLSNKGVEARCGLMVIDLRSGDIVHWLNLTGAISELYDVAIIPGFRRPMAIGLQSDEIRRVITIGS